MRKICMFAAGLSLTVFATMARANLLDDGSFELAIDGTQTSNSNWTLTANFPDGLTAAAMFSSSVWAASDGQTGVWFKSFEGDQDPSDDTANVELTQTASNVASGGTYELIFQSARETNFTAGSATATLSSSSGPSVSVDLLTATYNDDGNMASDPTTFALSLPNVVAGDDLTVSVEMVDGVDALANPQSLMVDNFVLVPEPASIVLIGLGLLGVSAIRRKRQAGE